MSETKIKIIAGTDDGKERSNNEDNFTLCPDLCNGDFKMPLESETVVNLGNYGSLLAVADGMGGLNAGEVASQIAIETIENNFSRKDELEDAVRTAKDIEAFMAKAVNDADAAIKKHAAAHPESAGMGTTIVMVWLLDKTAHFCWCGDSRAYIYNKDAGKRLERVTKDHSYVQQLIDSGNLTEDEAFDFPESNIITHCLGDFPGDPHLDFNFRNVTAGDIILLCSDGLSGLCRDAEIQESLDDYAGNISDLKNQLICRALDAGGYDNITVGLLEVVGCKVPEVKMDTNTHDDANSPRGILAGFNTNRTYSVIIISLILLIILIFCGIRYQSSLPGSKADIEQVVGDAPVPDTGESQPSEEPQNTTEEQ